MLKQSTHTRVVQLVDKLNVGGMERIAIDLANYLPQDQYRSYLCTTRADGPLRTDIASHVGYKCLQRKSRFDIAGLSRFVSFIREEKISIIHAHSSALFIASLASIIPPFPKVVWHCHSGWSAANLPVIPYYVMVRNVKKIIAVNDLIKQWIISNLRYPADRICYVPNFSSLFKRQVDRRESLELPGTPGRRIVCVAGLWTRKDQLTLIRAMSIVREQVPDAHLILVGGEWDKEYVTKLKQERSQLRLDDIVTFLGVRRDIAEILNLCDVGVLSSLSEGLPVAVLEYGLAGLGVVCTQIGQCAEVLDDGNAGLLVPTEDPSAMASALVTMMLDPSRRSTFAKNLQDRVQAKYSLEQAITKIVSLYNAC